MGTADTSGLLARLKTSKEKGDKSPLLTRAISLLEAVPEDGAASIDVLTSLLTDILKPLFASTPNPNLTPAGRKNLVSASATTTTTRFDSPFVEAQRKPWKQTFWCVDVLRYIVAQYDFLPDPSRRDVIEKQFYLLVPPILTLIDDGDISSKTNGCELLGSLSNTLSAFQSAILSRSGLADVFADSLKANFMLLPTLTPENESLTLLRWLYPAFRSLVSATHPPEPLPTSIKNGHSQSTLPSYSAAGSKKSYPHRDPRQKMLDTILRHGILASYNHASDHMAIAELLIHEAALVISDMRINAVKYLSQLLPLSRSILTNPLGAAYPPLLEAACDLLSTLITNCEPRIASTWWVECLRMCVGCWVVLRLDLLGPTPVQTKLGRVIQSLRDLIGDEKFREAADMLVMEDEELKDLLYPT
jgi:tRNA nucleotidyltransferase (CCA-adding enzyme)